MIDPITVIIIAVLLTSLVTSSVAAVIAGRKRRQRIIAVEDLGTDRARPAAVAPPVPQAPQHRPAAVPVARPWWSFWRRPAATSASVVATPAANPAANVIPLNTATAAAAAFPAPASDTTAGATANADTAAYESSGTTDAATNAFAASATAFVVGEDSESDVDYDDFRDELDNVDAAPTPGHDEVITTRADSPALVTHFDERGQFVSGFNAQVNNLAVFGGPKVGKSSIVNSMCGRTEGDAGSCPVDIVECTRVPKAYTVENIPKVNIYDMPGGGTVSFPAAEYCRRFRVLQFDVMIFIVGSTIAEFDLEVIAQARRQGKPVLVVRSKLDVDLREAVRRYWLERRVNETALREALPEIRRELVRKMNDNFRDNLRRHNEVMRRKDKHELVIDEVNPPPFFVVNREALLATQRAMILARERAGSLPEYFASMVQASGGYIAHAMHIAPSLARRFADGASSFIDSSHASAASAASAASTDSGSMRRVPELESSLYEFPVDETPFMEYLFARLAEIQVQPTDVAVGHQLAAECDTPGEFNCPITLQLMVDPVVAADGFTYERREITEWLNKGNTRSPMSNAPLPHFELSENFQLRRRIQEYLQEKAEIDAQSFHLP